MTEIELVALAESVGFYIDESEFGDGINQIHNPYVETVPLNKLLLALANTIAEKEREVCIDIIQKFSESDRCADGEPVWAWWFAEECIDKINARGVE